MHELSIAMSILDVAGEEAQRLNAKVIAIRLKLGPLSGVVKEALLSAYDLARVLARFPVGLKRRRSLFIARFARATSGRRRSSIYVARLAERRLLM